MTVIADIWTGRKMKQRLHLWKEENSNVAIAGKKKTQATQALGGGVERRSKCKVEVEDVSGFMCVAVNQ